MEQKEFDDLMNKIAEAIEPVYKENKELKITLSQKIELEERYKARIRLLENELQERDTVLVDTDKAYGKQKREYEGIDSNFRRLYQKVKDSSEKLAKTLTLWKIISKKNSKIRYLKDEIAYLKGVYEEKKE